MFGSNGTDFVDGGTGECIVGESVDLARHALRGLKQCFDGWWLKQRQFTACQAQSLYIGVGLRNIYTDAGLGELYNDEPVNLFLRPSISEGDVRAPEVAYGRLETWSLRFSDTVELFDPFESESAPIAEIDSPEEPLESSDAEKTLASLERLIASLGSLRTTVIRLGWLLVVVIIVSALIM